MEAHQEPGALDALIQDGLAMQASVQANSFGFFTRLPCSLVLLSAHSAQATILALSPTNSELKSIT